MRVGGSNPSRRTTEFPHLRCLQHRALRPELRSEKRQLAPGPVKGELQRLCRRQSGDSALLQHRVGDRAATLRGRALGAGGGLATQIEIQANRELENPSCIFFDVNETLLDLAALRLVAEAQGIALPEEDARESIVPMRSLPPHPDVEPALRELSEAGFKCVALTNSSQAAMEAQLDHAGLSRWFELRLSVESVRAFKPDGRVYRWALEQTKARADRSLSEPRSARLRRRVARRPRRSSRRFGVIRQGLAFTRSDYFGNRNLSCNRSVQSPPWLSTFGAWAIKGTGLSTL